VRCHLLSALLVRYQCVDLVTEISTRTKIFNRIRNLFFALILSLVAFIVILQSTIYRNEYASNIPTNSFCLYTAPSLFRNISTTASLGSLQLTRPLDTTLQKSLDNQCQTKISNSFYAIYTVDGNFNQPVVPYSIESCNLPPTNICPAFAQSTPYCPCLTTSSKQICSSKDCQDNVDGTSCTTFAASYFGYCYCKEQLLDILINAGPDVLNKLKQQESSSTCNTFFYNYTTTIGLSYISIIVTIAINKFLLEVLNLLTRSECYNSLGQFDGSFMMKVFFLSYINLSVLVILASGKANNLPDFFKTLHIFDGTYLDFDPGWYGSIGTYFITSFILQAIAPLAANFADYYFINPIRKWITYPRVM
jgi:hypothetical protein